MWKRYSSCQGGPWDGSSKFDIKNKFSVFVSTETPLRTNLNIGQNPFQLTTLVRCRVLKDSPCLGTEINQSAMSEVSRWILATNYRLHSHSNLGGIFGRRSGTGTGFCSSTSVSLSILIASMFQFYLSSRGRTVHNKDGSHTGPYSPPP